MRAPSDVFARGAEMHKENAIYALNKIVREAISVRDMLQNGETPPMTVGGSFLNGQVYNDAERSLVRWFDAASAAALTAAAEENQS